MKTVNELLEEAKKLKTFGDTHEKCIGDGMRIATYELKALLEKIHNELSNTIDEQKSFIIERAKDSLDVDELSEIEMEELFDIECTGDVFRYYDMQDWEHHNFELGRYLLAKQLIKLLD